MDAMRVCNSVSFSSSEQEESSSCDESANSTQLDRVQQDKTFYSSEDEYRIVSGSRKRLQSSQNHPDDSKRKSVEKQSECLRRPTRRPDPNTFNRNAIMARENRRKKKEYVEKLESEVDSYKSENKKLRKMLKHQFKAVEKINHERSYLRSVLANKTQIMSLINVIKNANLSNPQSPIAHSTLQMPIVTAAGLGDLTEPDYDLSLGLERFDDNYLPSDTEVLNDALMCPPDNHNRQDVHATINEEHNYFAGNNNDPGVCLHVSGGQLSLEFCSTCNDNAKNSWLQTN